MIVRCGRCQIELEVAGTGEFLCPSCGTRNMVRGPAAGAPPLDPYGLPDLGAPNLGGLSTPPPPPAGTDEPAPGITWETCPACSYRFARGEVDEITCPSCQVRLQIGPEGPFPVQEGSPQEQRN